MKPRAPSVFLLALLLSCALPRRGDAAPKPDVAVPKVDARWVTPKPPYLGMARLMREQGTIYVQITTGPTGAVTNVVVTVPAQQRQDMHELGEWSARWILERWHGPPNVTRKVVIIYRLR